MSQHPPAPAQYPSDPPKKSNTGKTILIILAVVGGLFLCCCGGGIAFFMMLPEGGVRTSNNMESYATDYIADNNLLEPGEKIVAYYDVTMMGSSEECAILTDQRLLYHAPAGDTVILLKDITGITHHTDGVIGDTIEIKDTHGQFMTIIVPPFNDGPVFVNALEEQAKRSGYVPEQSP